MRPLARRIVRWIKWRLAPRWFVPNGTRLTFEGKPMSSTIVLEVDPSTY